MRGGVRLLAALALALMLTTTAWAGITGYRGSLGAGTTLMDGEENVARIAAGVILSDWQLAGLAVSPRIDAGVLLWMPHHGRGDRVTGASLRLTLQKRVRESSRWFWEVGTGALILSDRHLRNDLDMGTRWHFDSHIGLGRHFGPSERWSLIYQVHHASNGGATEQNPGVNFQLLDLVYRY